MAYNLFRRVFVLLLIQAVSAAEVRNITFGGDPRTAEEYNIMTFIDHFLKLLNLIHMIPLFFWQIPGNIGAALP